MNGKMKIILIMIMLAGLVLIMPVSAKMSENQGNSLRLVAKNSTDWSIEKGAWGQFAGKSLNFKATGLNPNTDYTLISYAEPWGSENNILASGKTNEDGYLQIKGGSSFSASNLICNDYDSGTGSKIWLVPSRDLNGNVFNAWNPSTYLFENNLVNVGC